MIGIEVWFIMIELSSASHWFGTGSCQIDSNCKCGSEVPEGSPSRTLSVDVLALCKVPLLATRGSQALVELEPRKRSPNVSNLTWHRFGTTIMSHHVPSCPIMSHHVPSCPIMSHHFAAEDHCLAVFIRCSKINKMHSEWMRMIENLAALWVWTVQVKVGAGWYPVASSDQPAAGTFQCDEGVCEIVWLVDIVCPCLSDTLCPHVLSVFVRSQGVVRFSYDCHNS